VSRKSRNAWFKRQNQQRQRNERSLTTKYRAMNAQMENYSTGQGGIQDRGVGDRPATYSLMNPFVYGMDQVRAAQWAWVMYAGDWAAQKVADIPVFDMYREGWKLKYAGDKANGSAIEKALQETEDRIELVTRFSQANRLERVFGGAVIIIGVNGREEDDPRNPLTPDMVDKGDLRFLNPISRNYVTKVEWDFDVNSPGYGRPKHYNIRGQIFHSSRVIIFDNNPLTPYPGYDFMTAIGNWDGMGVSVYGQLWDALMRVNSYQQGASHLAQSANVWIAARQGLSHLQVARAGGQAIDELQRMVESLTMYRGYIIDGDSVQIQQLSARFEGMDDLILTGYQILAAGSDIPATRFFGQAPGGLSTDDRSGLENYYNNIAARQRLYLDPKLRKLEPYILNSTFGRGVVSPDEITREYNPLWNLSETEKAAIRTADIANITSLEAANLITRQNAVEELLKREAITVKPDLDKLERQADEMMSMAEMGGVDPEEAISGVRDGFKQPSAGGIKRSMSRMLSLNAGDWDENKHPRADDGKFGEGSGGGNKPKKDSEKGERHPSEITAEQNIANGRDAIKYAVETKSDVPNAMFRKELGNITFLYGEPGDPERDYKGGYGVSHVQAKHGNKVLEMMPEVIGNGTITRQYGPRNVQRADIKLGSFIAVMSKFVDEENSSWLLTGWDENVPR
jgi:phage-related protein (TIGR01555 family)